MTGNRISSQAGFLLGYALVAMTILGVAAAAILYSYQAILGGEGSRNQQNITQRTAEIVASDLVSHFFNVSAETLPAPAQSSTLPSQFIPVQYTSTYQSRPIGYCVRDLRDPADPATENAEVRFSLIFTRGATVSTTCDAALQNNPVPASGEQVFTYTRDRDFQRILTNSNQSGRNTVPPTGCGAEQIVIYNPSTGFSCQQEPDTGVSAYAQKGPTLDCDPNTQILTLTTPAPGEEPVFQCMERGDSRFMGELAFRLLGAFSLQAGSDIFGISVEESRPWRVRITDINGNQIFENQNLTGNLNLNDLPAYDPSSTPTSKNNMIFETTYIRSPSLMGAPKVITIDATCRANTGPLGAYAEVLVRINGPQATQFTVCRFAGNAMENTSTRKNIRETSSYVIPNNATSIEIVTRIGPAFGSTQTFANHFTGGVDVIASFYR